MDVVTSPSSSLSNGNDDDDNQEETLLDRLRRRALQHVRPSRREQTLIRMLRRASSPTNPTSPPAAPRKFREVLRRPKGGQHHLIVSIGGRPHGLVLNAQGIIDPAREDYLWKWLVTRVQRRGTE